MERFIVDDCGTLIDRVTRNTYDYVSDVAPLLNTLSEDNKTVQAINLKLLKREKDLLGEMETNEELILNLKELKQIGDYQTDRINELQIRNNRQAETLDNLFKLIENEDWEGLKQIIQDLKDCDEQLEKEWKCYDD